MPTIEITAADFARLKKYEIKSGSPTGTLSRMIDFYEEHAGRAPDGPKPGEATAIDKLTYTGDNIPPLRHTRVIDAAFDGQAPDQMRWKYLARLAMASTLQKVASISELAQVSDARLVEGEKIDDGYIYLSAHGFSCPPLSSNASLKIVVNCARHLGVEVLVEFEWPNKQGAHQPGKRAIYALGE